MVRINAERLSAQIEGDFVVFLIGIRINRPLMVHKWLPAVLAMPRMLRELSRSSPEQSGFLGYSPLGFGNSVQYWRSFDHLERYANAPEAEHYPAWRDFNKRMKNSRGDLGIWHETYLVRDGQYETLYSGMPDFGLGKAAACVPAMGTMSRARSRVSGAKDDQRPV